MKRRLSERSRNGAVKRNTWKKLGYVVVVVAVIPFILDIRLVDVPAGVIKEEGHTGFLHLPCAVLEWIFLARRIQPFLSLVEREFEFCVLTI